jgi:hypothetical protein
MAKSVYGLQGEISSGKYGMAGIRTEKPRARILFDLCVFLLNCYWVAGIPEKKLDFACQ